MSDELNENRRQFRALRQAQAEDAPSFDRMWRKAENRHQTSRSYRVVWVLAFAAVCATTALVLMRPMGDAPQYDSRTTEQEFAAVDSTLLLHWQAPTDVLFDTLGGDESFEP